MTPYYWAGFEIIVTKYYSTAVAALLFYDYLLTLQREASPIWGGNKSWIFFLFLLNRYVPTIYEVWTFVALNYPPYTGKSPYRQLESSSCDKAAIIEFIFLVLAILLAQVFFVVRLYALAGESRKVLVVFALLTIVQVTLGIVFIVLARDAPSILLPLGHNLICIPDSRATFNIRATYTFFSLAHG
ncbi:hypothetical protein BDM02DRAFT_3185562 [Thelephora ganbajun]|uniref:Uncharacterized protein n=1 Tax=Thelephora ganbajun TaxID=370292 RepID=A0ACB6ZK59_THEGA|nr:hypothetical protein BDM02DRAFT_3185562 [Thelephora ganbajun]